MKQELLATKDLLKDVIEDSKEQKKKFQTMQHFFKPDPDQDMDGSDPGEVPGIFGQQKEAPNLCKTLFNARSKKKKKRKMRNAW